MKKAIWSLSIVSFLSLSLVAALSIKKNRDFSKADGECVHSGFHYEALDPTVEDAGHKEFWTCCKCHEAFLEEPSSGSFIDQDDEDMIGEIDEEHIAYVAPLEVKSLTVDGYKYFPIAEFTELKDTIFFDKNMNEIAPSGIEDSYQMSDLGSAEYYALKVSKSFMAIRTIQNVSYNAVYSSFGTGVLMPSLDFKENHTVEGEVIEPLTVIGDIRPDDAPTIYGVPLNFIYNAYREYGFASSNAKFLSCVSIDSALAFAWNCDYAMWMQTYRDIDYGNVICVTRTFN